jgi:hypothetical protein
VAALVDNSPQIVHLWGWQSALYPDRREKMAIQKHSGKIRNIPRWPGFRTNFVAFRLFERSNSQCKLLKGLSIATMNHQETRSHSDEGTQIQFRAGGGSHQGALHF